MMCKLICFLPKNNLWVVETFPEKETLAMEPDGFLRKMTAKEWSEYMEVVGADD